MSKGSLRQDFVDLYLTTFLESVTSEVEKLWGSCFFSKCLKFKLDFKNAAKNSENLFCFSDRYIEIGIFKFFLIRIKYFSSAASVLTSSPKIWYLNKRDFFWLSWLVRDHRTTKTCSNTDFNSAWGRLPCWFSKRPLKLEFLDIYLTTFAESVISEIQELWGSSFLKKYSRFNSDFKNVARNWEKVFSFWYNCIWIGIVKLSLLRTRYFSSPANVLTSSPKILHVNKRDFFQLN